MSLRSDHVKAAWPGIWIAHSPDAMAMSSYLWYCTRVRGWHSHSEQWPWHPANGRKYRQAMKKRRTELELGQ